MLYYSTRDSKNKKDALYAIKNGIASDGGLFIPEVIPSVSKEAFEKMKDMEYYERAAYILSLFIEEIPHSTLLEDCKKAYSSFTPSPAPIHKLEDGKYVLELFHGPTCAFKDMALQIMPRLLSRAIMASDDTRDALILTATSGDTGKAALEGYKDADRIKIMVFYPENGVSETQKLQMRTQTGDNLSVVAINGNFDDAQSGVKSIFADGAAASALSEKGFFLTSANSINWGRLAPQIAYYFSLTVDIIKDGATSPIDVVVPTGNFGNILAAYYAKRMGAPIGKLICASNSNDVLTVFLKTGVYDKNRPFYTTISPSMDILLSSNLERLLAILSSPEECAVYMENLSRYGKYTVSDSLKKELDSLFSAYCVDEDSCKETIKSTYYNYSYLIDPHTAVAVRASELYIKEEKSASSSVAVVSTASPYKFAESVLTSIYGQSTDSTDAEEVLFDKTSVPIPKPLSDLRKKKIRFSKTVNPCEMTSAVLDFADSFSKKK